MVDAGADLTVLKRHGEWKSSTVAEGYIEESLGNKRKIGSLYCNAINMPSTSDHSENSASPNSCLPPSKRFESNENYEQNSESALKKLLKDKHFNFKNCNVTINFQ